MGRNFLLNIADSGFSCAGYDLDSAKVDLLNKEGAEWGVKGYNSLSEFLGELETPQNIMLLVPAGKIVDIVVHELAPYLTSGGLLIDGGNSHFPDTDRRFAEIKELGFEFLGVGVSGGAEGARFGPSMMIGGNPTIYERVREIFEAVSAKVDDEHCAALVGVGSAGHFVKMVHNGIEYALMELIAEAYDQLKRGLGMTNSEIADTFGEWNRGELNSFLIEITEKVLRKKDEDSDGDLIDQILDTAGQKGTGKWTSEVALDMGIPLPTIDAAVTMRQISSFKQLRCVEAKKIAIIGDTGFADELKKEALEDLRNALFLSFLASYAQGMSLLRTASVDLDYGLDLANIAKIWRGGCIIRAKILEDIREAYIADPELENLMLADSFIKFTKEHYQSLRNATINSQYHDIPCMAFSSSLAYLAATATPRLPANITQAQRDFFGAHTYQRIDKEGTFTTNWES